MGCQANLETENELLICEGYCEENIVPDNAISYNLVFSESAKEMIQVAKVIKRRLKVRERLLDNG